MHSFAFCMPGNYFSEAFHPRVALSPAKPALGRVTQAVSVCPTLPPYTAGWAGLPVDGRTGSSLLPKPHVLPCRVRGIPSPGHNQGEEAMQAARAGGSREGAVPVGQPFPACHCLPQGAQRGKSHTARISMNTRKTERKKENNNKTKKTNLPSAHGKADPHAWQVLGHAGMWPPNWKKSSML